MSTVFITQDVPTLSFEPARVYGDKLIPVFPPGQVALSPQAALYHARKVLRDMEQGDWLVLAGDPIMIGICWSVVTEYLGRVRALKWDRRELKYLPIEVDHVDRVAV